MTLPGFRHDTQGTNAFLVKANPLIRNDELGLLAHFGMEYVNSDQGYHGSYFEDGSVVVQYTGLDETCEAIAALSQHDTDAYRQFGMKAAHYVVLLSWGMFAPAANPETFVEVLQQSEQGSYMLELMSTSAWDMICETFSDERVRASPAVAGALKPGKCRCWTQTPAVRVFTATWFAQGFSTRRVLRKGRAHSISIIWCPLNLKAILASGILSKNPSVRP